MDGEEVQPPAEQPPAEEAAAAEQPPAEGGEPPAEGDAMEAPADAMEAPADAEMEGSGDMEDAGMDGGEPVEEEIDYSEDERKCKFSTF